MSSSSVTFLYSESGCVWSHTQTRGVLSISVYSILLPLGSVSLIPKTTSRDFLPWFLLNGKKKKCAGPDGYSVRTKRDHTRRPEEESRECRSYILF